ncbi:arginine--tRNA ligase [bacterium SCSIO 12643]|nr:arginine--tRNA ligase [bacterium SCSIO 12643]
MNIEQNIIENVNKVLIKLFGDQDFPSIQLQKTRKEFEGDYTVNVFPLLKISRKNPMETAQMIGEEMTQMVDFIESFEIVKGFLNLKISNSYWNDLFQQIAQTENWGFAPDSGRTVMVEYSSPNTNKPLHLGHLRNNFLGYSVAEILKANGHHVVKTQIINDRGIHICKSMIAWQRFGDGETPESSGLKGDHLVGKYYVKFDQEYKKEIADLVAKGAEEEEAKKNAPILKAAQEMLQQWEAKEPEVYALWEKMNGWVYAGFETTYKSMGVDFDKLYYESDTYLYGKDFVTEGLEKGIFYKKEDGSVWIDLTAEGLDHKLVLRADGTAVYMTQDIGTAIQRYKDYPNLNQLIYTVGNEQDYHFKVLFIILQKLGFDWAKECYHLSYGMVELPHGKMKSREGTVVDADDLMQGMVDDAKKASEIHGHISDQTEEEQNALADKVGKGALKYFILKVDPKKKMLFDPSASIDLNGNTAPFIQYAHARIQSIIRRAGGVEPVKISEDHLTEKELDLIKTMNDYPSIIAEAGKNYSPANIANYIYDLVKMYNSFYQSTPIFNEDNEPLTQFRVLLSDQVGKTIKSGMKLLGIQVPDRM